MKVAVLYSSLDYDEFIGEVIDPCGSDLKKNQKVCVILDYNNPSFTIEEIDTPLSNLNVLRECVFPMPQSIEESDYPLVLPLIKYGTISCYVMQKYNVTPSTIVSVDASYNICCLMSKLFKKVTNNVLCNSRHKQPNIQITINENIVDINSANTHEHIDFHFKNVIGTFGIENVRKVMEYVAQNNIFADVIHLSRTDSLTRSKRTKSRFFDILDISLNSSISENLFASTDKNYLNVK